MAMKFDAPAGDNLFDKAKVVGKSTPRIDGPLKTTGTAPYAYERHDVVANQAYGYVVGAGIAKGRISSMDVTQARASPGVLAIITAPATKPVGKGVGIGLSTCYGIVKEHCGEILVFSEQGKGSRFIVRLPANPETQSE